MDVEGQVLFHKPFPGALPIESAASALLPSSFDIRCSVFDILRFSSAPSDGGYYRTKHSMPQSAKELRGLMFEV